MDFHLSTTGKLIAGEDERQAVGEIARLTGLAEARRLATNCALLISTVSPLIVGLVIQ